MAEQTVEAKLAAVMERLAALQEQQLTTQQAQLENTPKKRVEFGEYYERWKKGRPVMTRPCFHTGHPLDEDSLEPEQILLLNRISRSGYYIDKMVQVNVQELGGGQQAVHIAYNNATNDQRNLINRKVKSDFTEMLKDIVAAQDLENAEEQVDRDARKAIREGGTFGNNKAYREAKAVADARASNG